MPRNWMALLFLLQICLPHTRRRPLRATGLRAGPVLPPPQTLATPPPPQVWGEVQVPHITDRDWPQLSFAVTVPQFLPSREQKAGSLSGVQVPEEGPPWISTSVRLFQLLTML